MKGQPGAFVEQDGTIMPDANDEAMAKRQHTAEGDGVEKTPKPVKTGKTGKEK